MWPFRNTPKEQTPDEELAEDLSAAVDAYNFALKNARDAGLSVRVCAKYNWHKPWEGTNVGFYDKLELSSVVRHTTEEVI